MFVATLSSKSSLNSKALTKRRGSVPLYSAAFRLPTFGDRGTHSPQNAITSPVNRMSSLNFSEDPIVGLPFHMSRTSSCSCKRARKTCSGMQ